MLQRAANRSVRLFRERDPLVAAPCKLGIEGDGAEAGDLQPWRRLVRGAKERLDGLAVAAVVAAHVLDVTQEAIGPALSSVEGPALSGVAPRRCSGRQRGHG